MNAKAKLPVTLALAEKRLSDTWGGAWGAWVAFLAERLALRVGFPVVLLHGRQQGRAGIYRGGECVAYCAGCFGGTPAKRARVEAAVAELWAEFYADTLSEPEFHAWHAARLAEGVAP